MTLDRNMAAAVAAAGRDREPGITVTRRDLTEAPVVAGRGVVLTFPGTGITIGGSAVEHGYAWIAGEEPR